MKREEYLEQRQSLMEKAKSLLKDGKVEDANSVMEEIEALDDKYEAASKAKANLEALNNVHVPSPVASKLTGNTGVDMGANSDDNQEPKKDVDSELYRTAFLNRMMNKSLTANQSEVFERVNEAADNGALLIPTTISNRIWEEIDNLYPFYAATTKTNIRGAFELIQEDESSDAKFYEDEETETTAGKVNIKGDDNTETFRVFLLSGCELARVVEVSWKMKEMSMTDFEDYIVRKMAKKMGAAAANSSVTGKGKPGSDDKFKPEPYGTITVLKEEAGKPQVVEVSADPTFNDITDLISRIKSGYQRKMYANNTYIWKVLANITDKNGRPYFIADTTAGGVGRILGCVVEADDSIPDDTLLCGDASMYHINFNKEITLDTEDSKKKRKTAYIGYAIMDGAPISNKAFAVLTKAAE